MDGLVHLTNPLQLLMLMSSDHYNPPGLRFLCNPATPSDKRSGLTIFQASSLRNSGLPGIYGHGQETAGLRGFGACGEG